MMTQENNIVGDEERNPVLVDEYDIVDENNHLVVANHRMRAMIKMVNLKKILCWTFIVIFAFVVGRLSSSKGGSKIATNSRAATLGRSSGGVLVTGATGRTGSRLYHELKNRGVVNVKAMVRDVQKAKEVLKCEKCDETEGVYVGDVTLAEDLERILSAADVTTLAIAVGATPSMSTEMQRSVEFDSVVNSVKALLLGNNNNNNKDLRVVLCSTIGTATTPAPAWSGDIEFWKLNAEAFLSTSGVSSTIIVKPCGLVDTPGHNSTLLVGHNDEFMKDKSRITISRDDVARVMAEAVVMEDSSNQHYRFDLCSKPGKSTEDLTALIQSSKWGF
eukprot:CAMPEP_0194156618 /NCGR_PEP_ID=MMETSP0152-20130528/69006_1 /TAXON_ID=1049557 /ORGANISM="Thalassiothrix antarctica, Strain L6-D1" /LENGTH=331 /DNA_ID=CAMNT_0038864443 /DNA_START=121 /DNA_END=1116 /DNA_ORIENTATION=+